VVVLLDAVAANFAAAAAKKISDRFLARSPLSHQLTLVFSPCLAEAGAAVPGQELSRHGKKCS